MSSSVLGAGLWSSWADARRGARAARGDGGGGGGGSSAGGAGIEGRPSPLAAADIEGKQFVAAACVLRLLVLPGLCLPLHVVLTHFGLLSGEPVLLMVLSISAGTPSSQTLVMLFNARGAERLAAEASRVYVPMYLLSVLTVSMLIVLVCLIVGEHPS